MRKHDPSGKEVNLPSRDYLRERDLGTMRQKSAEIAANTCGHSIPLWRVPTASEVLVVYPI